MSWLRRLMQPLAKPSGAKGGSSQSIQTMPTVKIDSSVVSENGKTDLLRNIELLDDVEKIHVKPIYELALRSIVAGGDLHLFCTELMKMGIDGMTKGRASEIGRALSNKAKATISRERQAALGITHATWMYANAPCMKDPRHPTDTEAQQDSAHRSANGKKFEVGKGLFLDGKWTWPGVEEGCKCSSRAVLPGLE